MKKKFKYIKSLDSLRALAVIFVLGYHFRLPFFNGGFIGVDIFFVLSGYLITSQLIKELNQRGRISLKDFWLKRIRRLYPALISVIVLTSIVGVIKIPSLLQTLWQDDLAGILGVSNWWYIIKQVPYADIFSKPSPLKHLWSLAVEAQFYLFFPLLLQGLHHRFKQKKSIVVSLLTLALVSLGLMMFLYTPQDINRAYYGTDTRIFTLLLGAILAYVYPENRLNSHLSAKTQKILDTTSRLAGISLLLFIMLGNEFTPFLYRGGFFLLAVLALAVLAVAIHPGTKTYRVLSNDVLAWLGRRSYSLYLWHYPILVLFTPPKITGVFRWALILFQLILTFLISEISYKYIETPLRREGLKQVGQKVLKNIKNKNIFLELLIVLFAIGGMASSYFFFDQSVVKQSAKTQTEAPAKKKEKIVRQPIDSVYMIGDSVMLGSKDVIEEKIPNSHVDADVGRQFYELKDMLKKEYLKKLNETSLVVVGLGTNGPFSSKELTDIYQLVTDSGAHLAFINTRVPLNWQNQVNNTLKDFAKEHQEVLVVDWFDYAEHHLALLENDGVHSNAQGHEAYVTLIKEAIDTYYINEAQTTKQ